MRSSTRRSAPRKPRKPVLSPTKISTFLACRVMYKYTYIDRIGRFYYQPKAYHSFGASLHRTLERYHELGGPETQSAEQLVETLHDVWTSLGYATAADEALHIDAASRMLEHYHEEHRVEGVKTLFTERPLKCDMGEFDLMGRLDRLDEHPDGRLEVIDYKSGRMSVTEDDVRDDLAMRIYGYLVRRAYPERPVSTTIYCLRTGEKATVVLSADDLAEIEDGVRAIAIDILRTDEDSVVEPVWLPHVCPRCDYLRLCARRTGWDVARLIAERDEPA